MMDTQSEIGTEEVPIDEYLEIPDILGGQDGDYLIQVNGASFDRWAILEGDYLVVRPNEELDKDALTVAVQRCRDSASTVVCEAERLPSSGVKVLGALIGVIRKI